MSEGRSLSELIRRLGLAYMGHPNIAPMPQFLEAIGRGDTVKPVNEKQPGRRKDLEPRQTRLQLED